MTEPQSNNYGFQFREWQIYKDAIHFRSEINKLVKTYPAEEGRALAEQTRHALNAIVLNIAESSTKTSDRDARVYLNRSHRSVGEVAASLDCAMSDDYLKKDQHGHFLEMADGLARKIKDFMAHIPREN